MKSILESIYRDHRQGLFSLALSITRNTATAEDAVHNAFVRLVRRETPVKGDPVTYTFTAVRNACIDLIRKASRRPEVSDTLIDVEASAKDDGPGLGEEVSLALEQLPDEQRELIVMKVYSELTFQQNADVFEEPLSTISGRYNRALKALKKKLEVLI